MSTTVALTAGVVGQATLTDETGVALTDETGEELTVDAVSVLEFGVVVTAPGNTTVEVDE